MTSFRSVGISLPQTAWVKLNCLQTGVVQFHSCMHKWGLSPSQNCECSTIEQIAGHILIMCWQCGQVVKSIVIVIDMVLVQKPTHVIPLCP